MRTLPVARRGGTVCVTPTPVVLLIERRCGRDDSGGGGVWVSEWAGGAGGSGVGDRGGDGGGRGGGCPGTATDVVRDGPTPQGCHQPGPTLRCLLWLAPQPPPGLRSRAPSRLRSGRRSYRRSSPSSTAITGALSTWPRRRCGWTSWRKFLAHWRRIAWSHTAARARLVAGAATGSWSSGSSLRHSVRRRDQGAASRAPGSDLTGVPGRQLR